MKELQLLEATRRKFRFFQQQQKEIELSRLDDEIRRKVGIIIVIGLTEPDLTYALKDLLAFLNCQDIHKKYALKLKMVPRII